MDPRLFSPEFLAENQSYRAVRTGIAMLVVETIFVALFFISRYKSKASFGMDTYLMAPGYICCLGLIIMTFRKSRLIWVEN